MRVTNSMIMNNSKSDINTTKLDVNSTSHQMQTQKKISRPSEDPVIAIRSLRYATSLNHIDQYLNKNIEDADSWLDLTETALTNMYKSLETMHTLADQGANGTNTSSDLSTILTSLESLQESIYSEGNADYAGRSIFTSYRTNCKLTFQGDEMDTIYNITEPLNYTDMAEARYYNGTVTIPQTKSEVAGIEAHKADYNTDDEIFNRIRLSYKNENNGKASLELNSLTVKYTETTKSGIDPTTDPNNGERNITVTPYKNKELWEKGPSGTGTKKEINPGEAVFIEETGEIILADDLAEEITSGHAQILTNYTKKGFSDGELRPEYYFDCTINPSDPAGPETVFYEKFQKEVDSDGNSVLDINGNKVIKRDNLGGSIPIEYDINFIVANNQTLTVNAEASEVFNQAIGRDIDDMIEAVKWALDCNDKVTKIETMMGEAQYADEASQENLKVLLDAAKKEQTYSRDNLKKLYESEITKTDGYLKDVNLAITEVGNKGEALELTRTRVSSQMETIEELKSNNENEDLSSIMLNYSAAYVAYQAALTAASKIGEQSLLNYI
ncbi:MAG: flagellar hook-associated protein 3 [Saccharofermentans sp.]|nr:flagellar hook-associated protein 3 [Saccharofermentans sp.]